jgi:superoxide reductase
MTQMNEVYKCKVCGNVVEILHTGDCVPNCCSEPMQVLKENTVDAAVEKHIPVVEKIEGGVIVKVGAVEHPMTEAHYIEWIEVLTENKVYRKNLKPGEKPEAIFKLDEEIIAVRELCNIHGLWKTV